MQGQGWSRSPFGIFWSLLSARSRAAKLAELMTSALRHNQDLLIVRARQQTALAQIGRWALATDIPALLDDVVRLAAQTLKVDYCQVWELLPDGTAVQLRAGVGWEPEAVGRATAGAGPDSEAGYTLLMKEPVVVDDLCTETRFTIAPLLREHGVLSGMSTTIPGEERPFGVLGAYTTARRMFSTDDVNFLQTVAQMLAVTIARKRLEDEAERNAATLARTNAELTRQQSVMQSLLEDLQTSKEHLELQRRRLEESLRQLQEAQLQLIQAEKMESVGRLAAGVAHEVKNPLAILIMGTEYLARNMANGNAALQATLQDMTYAVQRANTVIKGLLDFSVSKTLSLAEESLSTIVEQALVLIKHELTRHHVAAVTQLSPAMPPVPLDRQKIEQVLVNLLLNAISAMPAGGTLTVRTALRGSAGPLSPEAPTAVVEIEDTGTGIPEDCLSKVFDPFFTTKPTGQGTGLGLTVAKKIVDLHEGTIELRNRPGGGAKATVTLPINGRDSRWANRGS